MKLLLATVVAVLAVPASAFAAGPTMAVRDVPLRASRTLDTGTPQFNMVGLHWRGAGAVYFKARTLDGRWSAWSQADADDRIQNGWYLGGLDWTGPATALRVRTSGRVSRVRAYYVDSPVEATVGAAAASRRLAAHHLALLVAGRRVDPPCRTEVQ